MESAFGLLIMVFGRERVWVIDWCGGREEFEEDAEID
jgi:hypothetical protein